VLASGCGRSEPEIVVSDLPPYTEEEARLYDDSIAQDVFDAEASVPGGDRFVEGVARADLIVPVRLVAINAERSEGSVRYELIADPAGPPLKGTTSGPLQLSVSRGSPSQAMLKALDTQLVGSKLIVIARRYQREGKLVLHFRAEADTVAARDAIHSALRQPPPSATTPAREITP
jgi:hypothetical protein